MLFSGVVMVTCYFGGCSRLVEIETLVATEAVIKVDVYVTYRV